jgi:hypothetical protein
LMHRDAVDIPTELQPGCGKPSIDCRQDNFHVSLRFARQEYTATAVQRAFLTSSAVTGSV